MTKTTKAPPDTATVIDETTEAPTTGASSLPEHAARLLDEVGEVIVGGRLYVKPIDTDGEKDA